MNDVTWKRRIIATLLVGALLRIIIAFGVLSDMPQTEDGPSYRQQAIEIIQGSVSFFYFPPGTAIAATPFYVLFGTSMHIDHAIAVAFWTLFTIASAALAWQLCSDKRQAWIATIMAVFLPHGLLATCTISSQPLAAALFAGSLCLIIVAYRTERIVLWSMACVLLSFSVVTRPATLLTSCLAAGAVVVLWKSNRRLRWKASMALVILVLAHLAVMMPVMFHNAAHGQGVTLSTNNEWNLLVGNNPYTPDYKTGHFGQRTFDQLPEGARSYLRQMLPHEQPAFATLHQRQQMRDSAVSYILDHPLRTLYRVTNRFRGFFGMDYTAARELQNTYNLSGTTTAMFLLLEGAGFVVVLTFWLAGLILPVTDKGGIWLMLLLVTAALAPYLVAFSVAKYHTIILPLLFPPSAATLMLITSQSTRLKTLKQHRIALIILVFIVALVQTEHIFHIVDNQ